MRHDLLPLLGARLGGDVTEVLAREAAVLRDDATLLDEVAREAARDVVREEPAGHVSLAAAELASLPPAITRRVVRHALARTSPAFQGAAHVDRVVDLAAPGRQARIVDLPGVRLERNASRVVLCSREGRGPKRPAGFRHALPVPGRVVIPQATFAIEAETMATDSSQEVLVQQQVDPERQAGTIDAQAAREGLWVRSRRPGDVFRPLGLGGRTKKLQDVFVDRKVPRDRRDQVPLVVDAEDRIVWVCGVGPSEDARVTGSTQSVVTLTVNRLGELG